VSRLKDLSDGLEKERSRMNMVLNFTLTGFMLFSLFMQGWEIYKDSQSHRQAKKLKRTQNQR